MKVVDQLHERFIEKSQRDMHFGALPVAPVQASVPVIAVDRWKETKCGLYKDYLFRRYDDRDDFVIQLFAYERSVGHNAVINIDGDKVSLQVRTRNIDRVTELDKEYARYADVLFRELVYSQRHADEG